MLGSKIFGRFKRHYRNNIGREIIKVEDLISFYSEKFLGVSTEFKTIARNISLDVASVPLFTKGTNPNLARVLGLKINRIVSPFNFKEAVVKDLIFKGESFSIIRKSVSGILSEIHLLPFNEINVKKENGQVFYTVAGQKVSPEEILHFRINSVDGITGNNFLSDLRKDLDLLNNTKEYLNKKISGVEPGYLTSDVGVHFKTGSKEDVGKDFYKILAGTYNNKRAMVLPPSMKWNSVSNGEIDSKISDLLEKETKRVYAALRFPVSPVEGKEFNPSNYIKFSLRHYMQAILGELNLKLVDNERDRIDFKLWDMIKWDSSEMQKFYQSMITGGVYSPNDVRDDLGLDPYKGGSHYFIQGAMKKVTEDSKNNG